MSFFEKFDKLLFERGLSNYRMAKDTGLSDSLIGYWRQGARKPTLENLATISNYLEVSLDWLVCDKTLDSIALTSEESDLLKMFRELDTGDKQDIFGLARMKYERCENRKRGYTSSTYTGSNGNSGPDEDFDASNGTA